MIETLVLSVLSIIFSSIELMRLKVYLQYTEEPKKKTELVKLKKDTDSESDDKDNWDKKFDNKEMAKDGDESSKKMALLGAAVLSCD